MSDSRTVSCAPGGRRAQCSLQGKTCQEHRERRQSQIAMMRPSPQGMGKSQSRTHREGSRGKNLGAKRRPGVRPCPTKYTLSSSRPAPPEEKRTANAVRTKGRVHKNDDWELHRLLEGETRVGSAAANGLRGGGNPPLYFSRRRLRRQITAIRDRPKREGGQKMQKL